MLKAYFVIGPLGDLAEVSIIYCQFFSLYEMLQIGFVEGKILKGKV